MRRVHTRWSPPRYWLPLISVLLAGCETLAMTMLGVGANIGINHQISGYSSRTFVRPLPVVLAALEAALAKMGIGIFTIDEEPKGKTVWAYAGDLAIEIELEALTPATTRMRVIARRDIGVIVDASTASAIALETEAQLRAPVAAEAPPVTRPVTLP